MSKRGLGEKIKLSSYDDMFGTEDMAGANVAAATVSDGQIVELPLSELYMFENHPFRVVDDENMDEMVESIKEYGVLVPAIARPRDEGGYELISGHRRKHASELAGKDTMPVMILFKEAGEMKNIDPASADAQNLVKRIQDYITENLYTCTNKILRGLGKMYSGGGDFTTNIDSYGGEGTAIFVANAIEVYCDNAE